jgi:hypothetical protein
MTSLFVFGWILHEKIIISIELYFLFVFLSSSFWSELSISVVQTFKSTSECTVSATGRISLDKNIREEFVVDIKSEVQRHSGDDITAQDRQIYRFE